MKKKNHPFLHLGVYLESPSPREGYPGLKFIQREDEKTCPAEPVRVFIVPHTHADLCWPEIPDYCIDTCLACIDDVVKFQEKAPGFRFTMEHAFYLRQYLMEHPESANKVVDLIKRGYFECGAFYLGPTELTAGGESLIRELYLGKRWLKEKFDINANVVWNVDCPGHTQQLPQILKEAGVSSLVIWKEFNLFEHDYSGYSGPCLFRFASPDGSDVLTSFTPGGYGIGRMVGFRDSFKTLLDRLPGFLDDVAAHLNQYQLPKIILVADGTDVERPTLDVVENIKLWNEKFKHPTISLATTNEFFSEIDRSHLPISKGEGPNWWDTIGSFQNERIMNERRCEPRQAAAEAFSTIAALIDPNFEYPSTSLEKIWENRLFASEHNSGGRNGLISDSIKLNKIKSARILTDLVLDRSLAEISLHINFEHGGIPIVVFNSLLWPRRDLVDIHLNFDQGRIQNFRITDHLGEEVPYQVESITYHSDSSIKECRLLLLADMPAFGYTVFHLVEGQPQEWSGQVLSAKNDSSYENQWFQCSVDPASGCLVSLVNKSTKEELLDSHAYSLGELITLENLAHDEDEHLTGNYWTGKQFNSRAWLSENGPLRATWIVEGECKGGYRQQKYSFYRDLPRIDITVELDWKGKKDLQVVQAYPFKLTPLSQVHYGVPFGYARFGQENPDWTKVHPSIRGVRDWVHVDTSKSGITLASEVIPFDFHDRIGEKDQEILIQPILVKTTYSCHDQLEFLRKEKLEEQVTHQKGSHAPYLRPENPEVFWHQAGNHHYRFGLSVEEGGFNPTHASRFAVEHQTKLFSFIHYEALDQFPHLVMEKVINRLGNTERSLPERLSFASFEVSSVIPTWLKQAENGEGIIIRCFETRGEECPANLKFFKDLSAAWETDIIEYDQVQLPVKGNTLSTKVEPYKIKTYRLTIKGSDGNPE